MKMDILVSLIFYVNFLVMFILVLVSVSFFTLFERKLLSYIQLRLGPNKVGFMGLFQAFSDGMKLFSKEILWLFQVEFIIYFFSPVYMFFNSLILWILYPFYYNMIVFNNFFLMVICILSLNIYPMMFLGCFSNSFYSLLGGIRSISQTISYEVSFILMIFCYLMFLENFNLINMGEMFLLLYPIMLIFFCSLMAELNRTPFDFSEGESELISGYNIEYMGGVFAFVFLGEYLSIMFLMYFFCLMNFISAYMIMMSFMFFFVILIRGVLPRFRYDKLMFMVWMNYLPITLNYLMFILLLKYYLFLMLY
uniref:NADH-ubiquinone oxidoreductase chain 1 n=1 Tax=Scelio sp. ZJUH_2016028 TaxID=2496283 RepID=A0A3Q8UAB2_9HYME|nr:NADH dehydrogenase subunit 1 [Scelio sp. ZJUH_2016028]